MTRVSDSDVLDRLFKLTTDKYAGNDRLVIKQDSSGFGSHRICITSGGDDTLTPNLDVTIECQLGRVNIIYGYGKRRFARGIILPESMVIDLLDSTSPIVKKFYLKLSEVIVHREAVGKHIESNRNREQHVIATIAEEFSRIGLGADDIRISTMQADEYLVRVRDKMVFRVFVKSTDAGMIVKVSEATITFRPMATLAVVNPLMLVRYDVVGGVD